MVIQHAMLGCRCTSLSSRKQLPRLCRITAVLKTLTSSSRNQSRSKSLFGSTSDMRRRSFTSDLYGVWCKHIAVLKSSQATQQSQVWRQCRHPLALQLLFVSARIRHSQLSLITLTCACPAYIVRWIRQFCRLHCTVYGQTPSVAVQHASRHCD